MSGHSKWSTIKHKKGALDKKRGKIFTKVIRELTASVKLGGSKPESNSRLRQAIAQARAVNMPSDTIQKSIKRAAGDNNSENFETTVYEGLGAKNVAVIVECLTDNKKRTVSNIRSIFNKNGGSMGDTNSVSYLFQELGAIEIAKDKITEEKLTDLIIEAGAEDYTTKEDCFEVYTNPKKLHQVHSLLEKDIETKSARLQFISQTPVIIEDVTVANKILNLLEALEDDDDVQTVWTNFEPSSETLKQLEEQN